MIADKKASNEDVNQSLLTANTAIDRYHPDILIFLTLIPIISGFNYYLTYSNVRFNGFFILTFFIDTTQGYAAWWAVRSIIQHLDKVLPFEDRFAKRLLIQLGTTTITGLAIIAILTEITSLVAKGKAAPLEFYSVDLVIISIWFFVINGIYVALYYMNLWRHLQHTKDGNRLAPTLIARMGRETVRVEPDQLSGLFVDDNYVVAVSTSGRKHYLDQSLDKLERTLPSAAFFRINRQYILHRKVIAGFRRLDNGKLSVLLHKNEWLPAEVPMSRTRAVVFKAWFHVSE
jgi:DNA-binding LytR/AlgR family response regulator